MMSDTPQILPNSTGIVSVNRKPLIFLANFF